MNRIIDIKRGIIFLFIMIFFVPGCNEITTILPSPSIKINSVEQLSFTTFEIELAIEPGEGQIINGIELELEDLTILNSPKITERLDVGNLTSSSTIKHTFISESINHDYRIKAVLQTDHYQYQSEQVIYRCLKNNFFFNVEKDYDYNYLNPDLAIQINKGGKFLLVIDFLNLLKKKVNVTLNQTINCHNDIDLTNGSFEINIIQTSGFVTIPYDIQPGDYSIFIEIDDIVFEYDKKIRVLDGEWKIFNENYPGRKMGNYAWFRIDNKLYVVGGNFSSSSVADSPVWSLNLDTGEWLQKKDFIWSTDQYPYAKGIFAIQLSYKNQGYILAQTDERKIELWQYIESDDKWIKITDYPGVGADLLLCFNIENKIFVGGGVILELNNDHNVYDFWSYNLEIGKWEQLKDFPVRQKELWRPNTALALNGNGYVLEFPEKLWEYKPETESWTIKTMFPGPFREYARIVGHNNDIYLIGGFNSYHIQSYLDCWQYSINQNTWKMRAFMPGYTNHNVAISYDNSILIGLGNARNAYCYFDEQKIYRFIP